MIKFKKLDFEPGKITYDTFEVNPEIPFEKQREGLREDLFQVSYDDKYTIDIGWLPDLDPSGSFIVRIVKGYEWDEPVYLKQTNNLETLNNYIEECVRIMSELLNKKS